MQEALSTQYFTNRDDWRKWLEENYTTQDEIWLAYPKKATGKPRILYNDAVEEALCFGWIDSTVKSLNTEITLQRFCKRRKGSGYSQANKERLKWLMEHGLIHQSMVNAVEAVLVEAYVFPPDIIEHLKADQTVWAHYNKMSAAYRRIRIAYIDSARKRPEEFEKRLNNFVMKTKANQLIKGFGGIDKYY